MALTNLFKIYRRHIFVWLGSKSNLMKFLNELNTNHPTIKFEFEISNKTSRSYIQNCA